MAARLKASMANDWIKMRTALSSDPDVIYIAKVTDQDEDAIVGKLHRLWAWADTHTKDGRVRGMNLEWIDQYVRCAGFAKAMESRGWLRCNSDGFTFLHFDRHNGQNAKIRAMDQRRKQDERDSERVRDSSRKTRTKSGRKPDQRREEKNRDNSSSDADASASDSSAPREPEPPTAPHPKVLRHFCESWKAKYGEKYPLKPGKDGAHVKWVLLHYEGDASKACKAIDRYLADGDEFVSERRHPLGLLVSGFEKYTTNRVVMPKGPKMSQPGEWNKQTYSPG